MFVFGAQMNAFYFIIVTYVTNYCAYAKEKEIDRRIDRSLKLYDKCDWYFSQCYNFNSNAEIAKFLFFPYP
jgi:hypothetical protein